MPELSPLGLSPQVQPARNPVLALFQKVDIGTLGQNWSNIILKRTFSGVAMGDGGGGGEGNDARRRCKNDEGDGLINPN